MMGGSEPTRTETIRQTTMPTEIIQKTITIEGDGNQLTAEELRDIISKHAGDLGSSEVVTTVSCFIATMNGIASCLCEYHQLQQGMDMWHKNMI